MIEFLINLLIAYYLIRIIDVIFVKVKNKVKNLKKRGVKNAKEFI